MKTTIIFLLTLFDASTTYYIVTNQLGVEANYIVSSIINADPALVFPLLLAPAALAAAALAVADAVARRVPPAAGAAVRRAAYAAFAVSAALKTAVVINNIMIIAAGAAPLASLFGAT
jgi:hypothetical protein